MTPDEQRIAICEVIGWTDVRLYTVMGTGAPFLGGISPDGRKTPAPELTLDLLHEAEKKLTDEQWWPHYYDNLAEVTGGTWNQRGIVSATATQRAEALLRTLGKYTE